MINLLRQNQRILMLVIAVLTIVAFIFLYNPANLQELGVNKVARIYDRDLTQADIDRQLKTFRLALSLQELDLIADLGGASQNERQAMTDFVFNLFVLQHQARELGVRPTDDQVAAHLQALPIFQTDGQYDPRKYDGFVAENLGPNGVTQEQLWDVVRDGLNLKRIKEIVAAPAAVSPDELKEAGRVFQKVEVQLARFPSAEAEKLVTVSEEELKGFYERNRNVPALMLPETRAVEYVEFTTPAGKPLEPGKARVEALQKLADAATAFAEKAAATSFAEAASAAGLTVRTTPDFDRTGAVRTTGTAAPPEMPADFSSVASSVFLLNEGKSLSDPLEAGDRFYVVKLARVMPQRGLTFDEARPMAEARLRAMKAEGLVRQNADAALAKVREAMAGGRTFADAAQALGLTVETLKDLEPGNMTLPPEQGRALQPTVFMEPGQLSGFFAAPDGGFAIYLASRAPVDEAELAKQKNEIESGILESKRQLLFLSWLASAREASKWALVERKP